MRTEQVAALDSRLSLSCIIIGGVASARALLPFGVVVGCNPRAWRPFVLFACYIPTTISQYVTFSLLHILQP
jgi:hypothetical protein